MSGSATSVNDHRRPGRRRVTAGACAVVFVAAVAFTAALPGTGAATRAGESATAAAPPSFTLRVGDIMSFTGDLSSYGPSLDAAARLAASIVNETLAGQALGKRYALTMADSQDDQTKIQPAVEAALKLANIDKVNVIIGTISSGSTIAVAQSVSVPRGIVQITPTSDSPAIPALKDKDLVYQILPLGTVGDKALLSLVTSAVGKRARLNVGWRNDAWGNSVSGPFIASWKKNGGTIGQAVSWDPGATSFDSEAQRLVSGKPTAWVIFDFPPTFAKVAPALVRTGAWTPSKTFVTPEMRNASQLQKLGGQATNGLRGVSPSSAGGGTKLQKSFNVLFKQRAKGKPLTGYEATAFDAVTIAFLAALKAGSTDGSAIARSIRAVANPPGRLYTYKALRSAIAAVVAGKDINFQGVSGPLDFNARGGQSVASYDIWKYAGGTTKTVKTFAVRTE